MLFKGKKLFPISHVKTTQVLATLLNGLFTFTGETVSCEFWIKSNLMPVQALGIILFFSEDWTQGLRNVLYHWGTYIPSLSSGFILYIKTEAAL